MGFSFGNGLNHNQLEGASQFRPETAINVDSPLDSGILIAIISVVKQLKHRGRLWK